MRYLVLILALVYGPAWADSKRINVYPLSQNYWDVQWGDTLDVIVHTLIPRNTYLQERLKRDILALNPDVFPDGSPHYMLANTRLWLPNGMTQPDLNAETAGHTIESYQWGSIKRRGEGRGTRGED